MDVDGLVSDARDGLESILSRLAKGSDLKALKDDFFDVYVLLEKAVFLYKLEGSVESLEGFEKVDGRPEELVVGALDLLESFLNDPDGPDRLKMLRGARNRIKSVLILLRSRRA
ncbi:MAG: hypothetical protein J7K45_04320 [Thaumarchaeota archaeon]|nr:hypothetical protein [Nitrososphaerota archaeon]